MTSVFAIRNQGFKFKEFSLPITTVMDAAPDVVDKRELMKFNLLNIKLTSWWSPITAEYKQIEGEEPADIPDICEWRGACIVLSPKAYDVLHSLLEGYGEFLPVLCGGEIFHIFNCTTIGQIDEINSKQDIQDGVYMGVKNIRFNSIDIESKIVFKTTFDRCLTMFCGSTFKELVELNNLTGIEFRTDLADAL